jgi:hypothetical protein
LCSLPEAPRASCIRPIGIDIVIWQAEQARWLMAHDATRPNQELRAHVLNASTKEMERFFRLTNENQKRKIDACVALSFAILGAVKNGSADGFRESPRTSRR